MALQSGVPRQRIYVSGTPLIGGSKGRMQWEEQETAPMPGSMVDLGRKVDLLRQAAASCDILDRSLSSLLHLWPDEDLWFMNTLAKVRDTGYAVRQRLGSIIQP